MILKLHLVKHWGIEMSKLEYKLFKVSLELIDAKYINDGDIEFDLDMEDNSDRIKNKVDLENDFKKINIEIGLCRLQSKDNKILKMPVVLDLKTSTGMKIKIIVSGYFKFYEKIDESVKDTEMLEQIWPYLRENISSISAKMDNNSQIFLPPLQEVKNERKF